MISFDEMLCKEMIKVDGRYFRYCDDILCIVPINSIGEVKEIVEKEVERLHLNLHPDKTQESIFQFGQSGISCDRPLQYLGFVFDGKRKTIRSAAFARFSERMKSGVRLAKLTKRKHDRIRVEKKQPVIGLYKRKLYDRYSHLGKKNL